ncbi:sugar-binding domain-containing protein [Streptomyces sp. NPDC058424]|uniref:glycosyl hydrolase 2 galactose-binding domain-containing protein n=1 Tax=Streptomyces sp. NPDC058424 TaxID=3346491 RepID=UPI0036649634
MTEIPHPGRQLSRRAFVQAGAAVTALAVLSRPTTANAATSPGTAQGPATRTIPLNQRWLFGGEFVDGADQPGFSDSDFERITLPHTVTDLSWQDWDPSTWEKVWIYRRHFDVPDELAGLRLFLDFDGATTASTATLNGVALGDYRGGYLPFSYEITDHVTARDNVLAIALDSRFNINVPPNRQAPIPARTIDFWQPGGIDVFAKPADVLDPARLRLEVQCTVDAVAVPRGSTQLEVVVRDGARKIASAKVPVTITGPETPPCPPVLAICRSREAVRHTSRAISRYEKDVSCDDEHSTDLPLRLSSSH